MLEDFVLALPHQDALMKQKNIEKCKKNSLSTYIDAHKSKAIIHAFLATQK